MPLSWLRVVPHIELQEIKIGLGVFLPRNRDRKPLLTAIATDRSSNRGIEFNAIRGKQSLK